MWNILFSALCRHHRWKGLLRPWRDKSLPAIIVTDQPDTSPSRCVWQGVGLRFAVGRPDLPLQRMDWKWSRDGSFFRCGRCGFFHEDTWFDDYLSWPRGTVHRVQIFFIKEDGDYLFSFQVLWHPEQLISSDDDWLEWELSFQGYFRPC